MGERLTLTHGCSLSNLPLFVAEEAGYFTSEGLDVVAPPFAALSSTAKLLASGEADLGSVAFVQPLIDAYGPNPITAVAGSGLMGIVILAKPGIDSVKKLRGRRVGTFRGDPLEVLLHDKLAEQGMRFDEVEVVYIDTPEQAYEGFARGDLAAVTLAEPHGMHLRAMGAVELSDGTELWGDPFPDTILVSTNRFLRERPDAVRAAIRAMLRAERQIRQDPVGVLKHVAKHYPSYPREEIIMGSRQQPPCVDIRPYVNVILDRWASLQSLGLVPRDKPLPAHVVALDLLIDELDRLGRDAVKASA